MRPNLQPIASALPLGLAPARPDDKAAAKLNRWRGDLDRRHALLESVARSDDDRAALERAHADEVAKGPPESRIRRGSTFARPSVGLRDRNALVRLLASLEAISRGTWTADLAAARREGRTIRRTIARSCVQVLRALVSLAARHENVHPSRARLASMAQCSARTVDAALATLALFGFVSIQRRRKIVPTPHGGRSRQDTNAYVLHDPATSRGLGSIAVKMFGRFQPAKTFQLSTKSPAPTRKNDVPVDPVRVSGSRLTLWKPR